jgi:hypothetical protein
MADEDKGKVAQAIETVEAKANEVRQAIEELKAAHARMQAKRAERKGDED